MQQYANEHHDTQDDNTHEESKQSHHDGVEKKRKSELNSMERYEQVLHFFQVIVEHNKKLHDECKQRIREEEYASRKKK